MRAGRPDRGAIAAARCPKAGHSHSLRDRLLCTTDFSVDRKLSSSQAKHVRRRAGQASASLRGARVGADGAGWVASCPRCGSRRLGQAQHLLPAAAAPAGSEMAARLSAATGSPAGPEDRQADAAGARHQVLRRRCSRRRREASIHCRTRASSTPRAARPACCSGKASSRSISAGSRRKASSATLPAPRPSTRRSPGFTTSGADRVGALDAGDADRHVARAQRQVDRVLGRIAERMHDRLRHLRQAEAVAGGEGPAGQAHAEE